MALDDPRFQSAPWTLRGEAIVGFKWVRSDVARQFVPPDATVLCPWPGRTLALLYLAHYRDSPVGEYHEAIVAPAPIWHRGQLGFWVSHIFVNKARSIAAGRAIWALPKQPASMQWTRSAFSALGSGLDLQVQVTRPRRWVWLPFVGAAMSRYSNVESWFGVRGVARVGFARSRLQLADDLGLARLGFSGTFQVCVCERMTITIGRPRR